MFSFNTFSIVCVSFVSQESDLQFHQEKKNTHYGC